MPDQVIYSMVRVGKMYPPNRQVLRDISLGFFCGAKIGVLGLNGSGKSTLLKIMAGVDEEYLGETMLTKGYTRGLLEQEPQLDNAMTVKELCSSSTKINPPLLPLLLQGISGTVHQVRMNKLLMESIYKRK
jgi:sulfate-transporting ATPase